MAWQSAIVDQDVRKLIFHHRVASLWAASLQASSSSPGPLMTVGISYIPVGRTPPLWLIAQGRSYQAQIEARDIRPRSLHRRRSHWSTRSSLEPGGPFRPPRALFTQSPGQDTNPDPDNAPPTFLPSLGRCDLAIQLGHDAGIVPARREQISHVNISVQVDLVC